MHNSLLSISSLVYFTVYLSGNFVFLVNSLAKVNNNISAKVFGENGNFFNQILKNKIAFRALDKIKFLLSATFSLILHQVSNCKRLVFVKVQSLHPNVMFQILFLSNLNGVCFIASFFNYNDDICSHP
jgi:hypothetical protein